MTSSMTYQLLNGRDGAPIVNCMDRLGVQQEDSGGEDHPSDGLHRFRLR